MQKYPPDPLSINMLHLISKLKAFLIYVLIVPKFDHMSDSWSQNLKIL